MLDWSQAFIAYFYCTVMRIISKLLSLFLDVHMLGLLLCGDEGIRGRETQEGMWLVDISN